MSSTSNGTQTAITTVVSSGQSMMLYFHSDGSGNFAGLDLTVTLVKRIELADAADNTDAINGWQDGLANVTLSARTLYKDGAWNTLCLPFDVTLSGSPLDGATLMDLDVTGTYDTDKQTGFDTESGTLYLYFKAATSITAGTPYIIKWDSGADIVSPVFEGVTVSSIAASTVTSNDTKVQFIGTYGPTDIFSANKDNLFLGANNNLYWPEGEGMTSYMVNAFRAYFHVGNGSTPAPVQRTVISFGDDDATKITNTDCTDRTDDAWYDLSGRRIADTPAAPGIYIRNGRKVIVK